MGTIENKNQEKWDDSPVDITKLSYTNDYKSYLGTKNTVSTNRFNILQYLRLMTIIIISESIVLYNLQHKHFVPVAVGLGTILIATLLGKILFNSLFKSIGFAVLSTFISATLYYFK